MSKLHNATPILFVSLLAVGAGLLDAGSTRAQAATPAPTTPAATNDKVTPAPSKATAAKPAAAVKGAKVAKAGKAGMGAGGATGGATKASAPVVEDKDTPLTEPPASSSPLADLKKSNEQLDKLLKKKYPNWSPEGEAQKAAVQKLVGGFLDYRELARRALARHWDKLQPSQRQEFVATLRELVERSYLKQVGGDPNYNIKYDKEEKSGSEATVDAVLNTVARGKKVKITLVYKLVHKDRWLVYDVVTDEQSMLENYRAEFNKIINKDGFDALLKRMKRKLDEKDE